MKNAQNAINLDAIPTNGIPTIALSAKSGWKQHVKI